MALSGIDAVFELPAVYAISNAGDFAKIEELTKEAAAIVKEIRG